MWSVFIYSSFAVLVIVGGQSTTDDQRDNVDQLVDIVVRQQTELNRQQVELTKAVNEIEKLKEKVGQLEAQLSTSRPRNSYCKSHFDTLLGNIVSTQDAIAKQDTFYDCSFVCPSVCHNRGMHCDKRLATHF